MVVEKGKKPRPKGKKEPNLEGKIELDKFEAFVDLMGRSYISPSTIKGPDFPRPRTKTTQSPIDPWEIPFICPRGAQILTDLNFTTVSMLERKNPLTLLQGLIAAGSIQAAEIDVVFNALQLAVNYVSCLIDKSELSAFTAIPGVTDEAALALYLAGYDPSRVAGAGMIHGRQMSVIERTRMVYCDVCSHVPVDPNAARGVWASILLIVVFLRNYNGPPNTGVSP